jgi:hypothetical protein
MSKTFLAAAAVAALSFIALDARAFPVARAPSAGPEVTLVEGGCGPGFHRNEFNRCRPNGPPPAVVVAPVVVEPVAPVIVERVCPPGWHWGPVARRCVR